MAQDRVEAVERALKVLNAFNDATPVLTLKQLADATGLYKSTILRLIGSLEAYRCVSRQQDGRYRLGPELWRLGSLYQKSFDSEQLIRPVLTQLRDQLGQTAAFYIKTGDSRLCLYRENSTAEIGHLISEGAILPLSCGAAGHVLSAFTETESESAESAERLTAAQHQHYAQLREQGWCLSKGERNPDLAALAVPVIDQDAMLKGVLTLSGLVTRFDDALLEHARPLLQQAAGILGLQLADKQLM